MRAEAVKLHEAVLSECGIPDNGPLTSQVQQAADCVATYYLRQREIWLARMRFDAREEAERPIRRQIALQRVLQELNFLSSLATADGVYGPETRKAISDWQS